MLGMVALAQAPSSVMDKLNLPGQTLVTLAAGPLAWLLAIIMLSCEGVTWAYKKLDLGYDLARLFYQDKYKPAPKVKPVVREPVDPTTRAIKINTPKKKGLFK